MKSIVFLPSIALFSALLSFVIQEGDPKLTPYVFEELESFPVMPKSASNPVSVEGAELGRMLFYDPILSRDSTISCATCHQQKYAFAGNSSFDKGIDSALLNRNTMPLFNLAWNSALFWDGRANTIEAQVFHPVRDKEEMDLDWNEAVTRVRRSVFYPKLFEQVFGNQIIDSVLIGSAIAQFERTLISANSKFDQVIRGETFLTADEYEGFGLVNNQVVGNCLHCHVTDGNGLGTTGKFSNNGLDFAQRANDYKDQGKKGFTKVASDAGFFRIPSFRNLLFTAPYMHDGRFETLEDVLDFYSDGVQAAYNIDPKMALVHQGGMNLSTDEKDKIIKFLKTLSDSSFISNSKFSNPFPNQNY